MEKQEKGIFERLRIGEVVSLNDPDFLTVNKIVDQTMALSPKLNAATSKAEARKILGNIIGTTVDDTTTLFVPFHTNLGCFIKLGKGVFINHGCSFLDMGGITIEDDVQIGPRVNLVTENHPLDPAQRKSMICLPILIKRNAWIGAGATILPGVTVGINAVVAAGAVVSKNVPDNTVVAGIPAKIIKNI
ncbi:DapH/DapD/GlmU-related protein [Mucilaginibacter pocheonensis]|uniref:Acetyltransferase-like isoleucine patch superfamily enzyme n=1 Tax=Mucilaginibacter pocheonensis TaxID=398050 RepID=A0ABU1THA8_9SPHI|nr:DapH/DapD/GlmU-related protein [Mucilaginibacter pocheonensis]MDR6944793.1 acetyltransferase-like isoleucine patch superfamily enzyme [Mucilaginibacter pocheonensis]